MRLLRRNTVFQKGNKMMDFCRIELDDIAQINYNESKNADFLKTLFLSHRYVYVRNESHRLLGIITPTSFQNHFSVGKHVNYSFRYVIDCERVGGGGQQRYLGNTMSRGSCAIKIWGIIICS